MKKGFSIWEGMIYILAIFICFAMVYAWIPAIQAIEQDKHTPHLDTQAFCESKGFEFSDKTVWWNKEYPSDTYVKCISTNKTDYFKYTLEDAKRFCSYGCST